MTSTPDPNTPPASEAEPRLHLSEHLRHRPVTGWNRWGRVAALAILAGIWIHVMLSMRPTSDAVMEKLDNALWLNNADYAIRHGRFPLPEKPARLAFTFGNPNETGGFFVRDISRTKSGMPPLTVELGFTRGAAQFRLRGKHGESAVPYWHLTFEDGCDTGVAKEKGILLLILTVHALAEGRDIADDTPEGFLRVVAVDVADVEAWVLVGEKQGHRLGRGTLTPAPQP